MERRPTTTDRAERADGEPEPEGASATDRPSGTGPAVDPSTDPSVGPRTDVGDGPDGRGGGGPGEDGVADPPGERATPSEPPALAGMLKHILVGVAVIVVILIAFRLLAPHVGFLQDTWDKVQQGKPAWLIAAVVLELFSFLGYVWVVDATSRRAGLHLPRFTAWRITLAGVAATRLVATAGAGGIAATVFALRRHGLDARAAAATVAAQIAIVYVWFILLIAVVGGILFGLGHAHGAMTIIPASIAAGVLVVAFLGRPGLRYLAQHTVRRGGRIMRALTAVPAALDEAVHTVSTLVRERDLAIAGGALWWIADGAVLWAACEAFGASPHMLDVLMAYLLGQVANLLPVPGGLGVEAGITAALIAFGIDPGVAVLAGVMQRLISTWLPAVPGAFALASIGHASPDAQVVPPPDDDPPDRTAADDR
ncbi:MAG: flippase-like domain-containing protein [Solirubrobacteraceae bacterium]|nr:flippase-like domain-containing protein [Solirubrobacteraceae bacterium]